MKKKTNLTITRKKKFRQQKQYRISILNQATLFQVTKSSFFMKRKSNCFTPIKSPRTKAFTPSKSPHWKRVHRLFNLHGDEKGIPQEMLLPSQFQEIQSSDSGFNSVLPSGANDYRLSDAEILPVTEQSDMYGNQLDSTLPVIAESPSYTASRYCAKTDDSSQSVNTEQEHFNKKTTNGCSSSEKGPLQDDMDHTDSEIKEMVKLMHFVLECLAGVGLQNVFLDYFRQLQAGVQTTDNVAFLLWTDVVQWYNQPTAASMRYNCETKRFWRLGWKLFGVKFLNFMSGYKNTTQILQRTAERGKCDPKQSDINFIVPSVQTISEFTPYSTLFINICGGDK